MAQPVLYRAHRIKRLLDAIVVAPVDALVDQREHLPTGALPNSNSPTLRCSASTSLSSPGVSRRGPDGAPPSCAAFLFLGGNAAMPPPAIRLAPMGHGAHAHAGCRVACFCRMLPNTSSIAFRLVSMGMMGLLICPA